MDLSCGAAITRGEIPASHWAEPTAAWGWWEAGEVVKLPMDHWPILRHHMRHKFTNPVAEPGRGQLQKEHQLPPWPDADKRPHLPEPAACALTNETMKQQTTP
jgi:hypothetical protein